ncbi:MAG: peptide deformylase [Dethiobacteria bacterium]|nr:peptide deformylase [Dethiobacteria bacterium]
MALRKLLNDNHPVLRTPALEVKKINSGVTRLLDDMIETMHDADGVGLAANQVGVSKRILIAADGEEIIYELINPYCILADGESLGIEGCLSVPGTYGEVPRADKVIVKALNRDGKEIRLEAEGLLARILQHEMDHLDGILFTDKALRLVDPETLKSEE